MIDTSWITDEAACRGLPAAMWFPAENEGHDDRGKRICAECPLRLRCLEHAIEHGEPGIWGGTSDKQRREIRAARKRGQAGPIEVRLMADRPKVQPTRGRDWNRVAPDEVQHGTYRGQAWHKRNGVPVCEACLQAKREYDNRRRAIRKSGEVAA